MSLDKTINVSVQNKIAAADGTIYICGNSDYLVEFDFDREWDAFEHKTARFVHGTTYTDQVFSGNLCPVPVLYNVTSFRLGVFAGELSTTTPATVYAKKSILCGNGIPADPSISVYSQIMALLNDLNETSAEEVRAIVDEYMAENPASGSGEIASDEEVLELLTDT